MSINNKSAKIGKYGDCYIDVEYTQEFEKQVKARFCIPEEATITDEHVAKFIEQELSSALSKVGT